MDRDINWGNSDLNFIYNWHTTGKNWYKTDLTLGYFGHDGNFIQNHEFCWGWNGIAYDSLSPRNTLTSKSEKEIYESGLPMGKPTDLVWTESTWNLPQPFIRGEGFHIRRVARSISEFRTAEDSHKRQLASSKSSQVTSTSMSNHEDLQLGRNVHSHHPDWSLQLINNICRLIKTISLSIAVIYRECLFSFTNSFDFWSSSSISVN